MIEHEIRDGSRDAAHEGAAESAPASSLNHAVLLPLLACNARCPFCSTRVYTPDGIVAAAEYGRGGAPARRLAEHTITLDDAKERYRRLATERVPRVTLQGGEPTLWPGLCELIAFGRALGLPEQVVVTNGIKLAEADFARALSASGASTIALSIFGASAAVHDESLGLGGAFDAVVAGVKNLAALGPGGADVMAQLIVHARNLHELPEMLSFWHGLGVRHFAVRLLREVANTAGPEGRAWFFDLERLRAPLLETLERAAALERTSVVFPEIFYCLLPPTEIGFVVGDLAAARRIAGAVQHEARHVGGGPRPSRRRLPQLADAAPCQTCDLSSVCAQPEEPYRSLYTGALRSVRLDVELRAQVSSAQGVPMRPSISRLLQIPPAELDAAGLEPELLMPLRATRRDADTALRAPPHDTVVRFVSLASLGARDDLTGPAADLLARLARSVTPQSRASIRFLAERSRCIHRGTGFAIFEGRVPATSGSGAFWVVLHDQTRASESELARLVGVDREGADTRGE